jgi:hypothetical protein
MPKKLGKKDKAVKKIEKAVRKAIRKGADEDLVGQAVEKGMDRPTKRAQQPPKKQPVSVKATSIASKGPKALKKLADAP